MDSINYEPIEIECPNCKGSDYMSYEEDYDNEWISLLCDCLLCDTKFEICYRAISIDRLSYHQSMTGGKTNLEKMRGGRASDSERACP